MFFTGRKLRKKTFAILLAVSMIILLLPGISLGDTTSTFTKVKFISAADNNLTVGQTSTVNFNLLDDNGNQYTSTVYAWIVNTSEVFQFGSQSFPILPDANGKYSIAGVNFTSAGTYYLKVEDNINNPTMTATGTIVVVPSMSNNGAFINFVSPSDYNLTTGVTQNINYKLYNENGTQYTGPVTAYIDDPDGHSTSYTATSSSISDVTFDKPGEYTLYIIMSNNNTSTITAVGNLTVANANFSTSGSLITNFNSTITCTLTKADGDPLSRVPVTVDATQVGGTSSAYTTLYDGTFTITMTPTAVGSVKIELSGHTVGTIQVNAAYTGGSRIGGMNSGNADLSIAVAQKGWTTAANVILTRDDVVADAMVAAPLSKALNAPILMTPTNSLDSHVAAEIRTLLAKTVYIIGGTGAVSSAVEDQLRGSGLNIVRIAGADRYDTAAQIAARVGSSGTVYMAYGYGEPDALAAGPLAAEQGIPILLTETNSLPAATQNELGVLKPKTVVLLGGTGVISSGLEEQLGSFYSVQRWGGVDRYATEQIILQNFFNNKPALNQYPLYIASANVSPSDVSSGKPFGDALVTAVLAAKNNGFIITLPPNSIPNPVATFLLFNKGYIPSATVVGNISAISYNLEQLIQTGLAH